MKLLIFFHFTDDFTKFYKRVYKITVQKKVVFLTFYSYLSNMGNFLKFLPMF